MLEQIEKQTREELPKKKSSWFANTLSVFLGIVILMSILRFSIIKNYDIGIEESCDPTTSTCFVRDCETEKCPPNNLEVYHEYIIKGFDFARCNPEDTCGKFCANPKNCEEIKCNAEAGDVCSGEEVD
jgi:hypothetical protein